MCRRTDTEGVGCCCTVVFLPAPSCVNSAIAETLMLVCISVRGYQCLKRSGVVHSTHHLPDLAPWIPLKSFDLLGRLLQRSSLLLWKLPPSWHGTQRSSVPCSGWNGDRWGMSFTKSAESIAKTCWQPFSAIRAGWGHGIIPSVALLFMAGYHHSVPFWSLLVPLFMTLIVYFSQKAGTGRKLCHKLSEHKWPPSALPPVW